MRPLLVQHEARNLADEIFLDSEGRLRRDFSIKAAEEQLHEFCNGRSMGSHLERIFSPDAEAGGRTSVARMG